MIIYKCLSDGDEMSKMLRNAKQKQSEIPLSLLGPEERRELLRRERAELEYERFLRDKGFKYRLCPFCNTGAGLSYDPQSDSSVCFNCGAHFYGKGAPMLTPTEIKRTRRARARHLAWQRERRQVLGDLLDPLPGVLYQLQNTRTREPRPFPTKFKVFVSKGEAYQRVYSWDKLLQLVPRIRARRSPRQRRARETQASYEAWAKDKFGK